MGVAVTGGGADTFLEVEVAGGAAAAVAGTATFTVCALGGDG